MRERKPFSAAMAITAAMMLTGGRMSTWDGTSVPEKREGQHEDEQKFLATLSGAPLRIWERKIQRGLTPSELAFVRERLAEKS